MPPRLHRLLRIAPVATVLALAACATHAPAPARAAATLPAPPPPTSTPGTFTLHAIPLDVWNAVGDVVVRTPQASYDSRSQMLGLYSVRYRGEPLLILAHALPLSDSIHELTTEVTARSPGGAPIDNDTAAELLAILERELPAEVQAVRARQAAEAAAEKAKGKSKASSHATKHRRKR